MVSVEIDPPKGTSLDRVFEQVDKVIASGHVDSIDVNSGTLARVGMDAMMVAGALEKARGVQTIPHLTTRDLNLIGLQAILLGAWSIGGTRSQRAGDYRGSAIAGRPSRDERCLRNRFDRPGKSCHTTEPKHRLGRQDAYGGATNFTIGVALNPAADDLDREIERFHAKVEAGAHFAMTQRRSLTRSTGSSS